MSFVPRSQIGDSRLDRFPLTQLLASTALPARVPPDAYQSCAGWSECQEPRAFRWLVAHLSVEAQGGIQLYIDGGKVLLSLENNSYRPRLDSRRGITSLLELLLQRATSSEITLSPVFINKRVCTTLSFPVRVEDLPDTPIVGVILSDKRAHWGNSPPRQNCEQVFLRICRAKE
jgi:hypothetical protein